MQSKSTRTWSEILESTSYGRLYVVWRIAGTRFICHRLRRKGTKLYECTGERITIERTPSSQVIPEKGDYCFVDSGGVWSLWAVREKEDAVPG
jgi:hypothetical protein